MRYVCAARLRLISARLHRLLRVNRCRVVKLRVCCSARKFVHATIAILLEVCTGHHRINGIGNLLLASLWRRRIAPAMRHCAAQRTASKHVRNDLLGQFVQVCRAPQAKVLADNLRRFFRPLLYAFFQYIQAP